jgi:adenylate kinase
MNLIILGAPGSGKGTQAKLLAEKFGLAHLSSGELLRREAESGTPKGKLIADLLISGALLPFETVLEVLEPTLKAHREGFILDGTPRDVRQAEYLDYFFNENKIRLDKVIYIDIPIEEGIQRIMKRAEIEHRADDNYDSVKKRMEVYQAETTPVIDYYQKKGLLLKIDGTPDIQTIFKDIVNRLTIA